MNTKLSVALLLGLSLSLSVGAFAVSDDSSSDYINWSYVMSDTQPAAPVASKPEQSLPRDLPTISAESVTTTAAEASCTEGCPGRPMAEPEALVLTYEDEALPLSEQTDMFLEEDRLEALNPISVRGKMAMSAPEKEELSFPPVETQYIDTSANTQYPITRQYPISVQYPITVQRNMTVEQPVIVQQPVIVRRPVVMQQDITVQRQPTVVQSQPVVMQQQPTFIQQQPMFIQAPAGAVNPIALNGVSGLVNAPMPYAMPAMDMSAWTQPVMYAPMPMAQPYGVSASVQPIYPQAPVVPVSQPVPAWSGQQPVYTNPTY